MCALTTHLVTWWHVIQDLMPWKAQLNAKLVLWVTIALLQQRVPLLAPLVQSTHQLVKQLYLNALLAQPDINAPMLTNHLLLACLVHLLLKGLLHALIALLAHLALIQLPILYHVKMVSILLVLQVHAKLALLAKVALNLLLLIAALALTHLQERWSA